VTPRALRRVGGVAAVVASLVVWRACSRTEVDHTDTTACALVFRVGWHTSAFPQNPVTCLNEQGDSSIVVSTPARCRDGTKVYVNAYTWWSTKDDVLQALTDQGKPPPMVLNHCLAGKTPVGGP
jgi:hypothetical protein